MAVKLARIDDRLIHGQVILGWVPSVKPDRIVVANDRVAGSDWERKFYSSCVPPEVNVSFARDLECLRGLKNAELLAVLIDDSNLAHTDSVIHAEIFANLRAPLTMPCWQYRNGPGYCQDWQTMVVRYK